MHNEIKNHRLQEFCRRAAGAADKLEATLNQTWRTPLPKEIGEQLAMLQERLRRPEVRILILGPLKSGKSTLMTVLTKNPRVSQINQLPAYPCVVEVRDIDRGDAAPSPETSTFYKGESAEEAMPLAEGLEKLDALLRAYIRDEHAPISYERVVQRIDLGSSQGDLNLVLIDSPGLLFGRQGYSEETQNLLKGADVVIFVVRPEQLFFQSIKDYLEIFADKADSRRVFILVNASTQAKTLKGGRFEDVDQVEMKGELLEYFYRRIAGKDLNAELRKETNVSVHFADLHLAAGALLAGDADARARYESTQDSRAAVKKLGDYIQDKDLAAKKEGDIHRLFVEIIEHGSQFLDWEAKGAGEAMRTLEVEIQEKNKGADACAGHEQEVEADLESIDQQLRAIGGRLNNLPDGGELQSFGKRGVPASSGAQPLFPDEPRLRTQCEKIYDRWKDRRLGIRSLANLREVVWSERVLEDCESLAGQHRAALNQTYQQELTHARETMSEECLRSAVLCHEMSEPLSLPPIPHPKPPLLQFPLTRTYWPLWDLHLMGWTMEDLWGKEGNRVLNLPVDEKVLDEQRENFVGQMLHAPWQIKDCFSFPRLLAVAQAEFARRLAPLLKSKLSEQQAALRQRASEAGVKLEGLAQSLAQLREEKHQAEQRLNECGEYLAAVRHHQVRLAEVGKTV